MEELNFKLERLPKNYTFGIELEFAGGLTVDQTTHAINKLIELGYIRKGWSVQYDNSIIDENGLGAEIVSPILCDDEQTEKEIEIICEFIKNTGGKMDEKVGGHVHYGVQCLGNNIQNIKNFLKLYTIFEPLLYKISIGDLDHVRPGCKNYAKPIQNRLIKVIDSNINSLTELMLQLAVNVGANPTHYGENRYYGLNIQRIIEALRNIPKGENIETFIHKMFNGEELYSNEGEKLSPTIEFRFRNGSSNAKEILNGIRIGGQLFVKAQERNFKDNKLINSLYRQTKKRKIYVFDKVTNANREDQSYSDCNNDEEILNKKFMKSPYGDGIVDYNTFKCFFNILYPNISNDKINILFNYYSCKIKPTDYKENLKEQLLNIRSALLNQYIESLTNNRHAYNTI